MDDLRQQLVAQAVVWLPNVGVAHVSLIALGIITALGTLGVNITGLVAGLGLTGFALGFALKDSISNLRVAKPPSTTAQPG